MFLLFVILHNLEQFNYAYSQDELYMIVEKRGRTKERKKNPKSLVEPAEHRNQPLERLAHQPADTASPSIGRAGQPTILIDLC